MFRRVSLNLVLAARATPQRNRNAREVIHQSAQPAQNGDVDFGELKLKYKFVNTISAEDMQKRSGWTAAPSIMPDLPFHVARSDVSKSLPVYTEYKGGRTKINTVLRKVSGDIKELTLEMQRVCDGNEVEVRPGKLIVNGNYHWRLKLWLAQLGF